MYFKVLVTITKCCKTIPNLLQFASKILVTKRCSLLQNVLIERVAYFLLVNALPDVSSPSEIVGMNSGE